MGIFSKENYIIAVFKVKRKDPVFFEYNVEYVVGPAQGFSTDRKKAKKYDYKTAKNIANEISKYFDKVQVIKPNEKVTHLIQYDKHKNKFIYFNRL